VADRQKKFVSFSEKEIHHERGDCSFPERKRAMQGEKNSLSMGKKRGGAGRKKR